MKSGRDDRTHRAEGEPGLDSIPKVYGELAVGADICGWRLKVPMSSPPICWFCHERGDTPMNVVIRAATAYFFLLLVVRVIGRRPGSQMTPFEFVLIFFIGGIS